MSLAQILPFTRRLFAPPRFKLKGVTFAVGNHLLFSAATSLVLSYLGHFFLKITFYS